MPYRVYKKKRGRIVWRLATKTKRAAKSYQKKHGGRIKKLTHKEYYG